MRAVNQETGEVVEFVGGQWVPVDGGEGGQAAPRAQPAQAEPQQDLTTGPINAALIGAGDLATRMGRNARDVWANVTGNVAQQRAIENERREAQQITARLRRDAPIASIAGEFGLMLPTMALGGGLPGLAMLAARGGTAAKLGSLALGQGGLGAVQGALSSESGDLVTDAATSGALGAAGSAVGSMLPAASQGARNMVSRIQAGRTERQTAAIAEALGAGRIDEATADLLTGAQRAGLRLTPGQLANSDAARKIEASLVSNPLTSGPFEAIDTANRIRIAELAGDAMGIGAVKQIGPNEINTAIDKVGKVFENVGSKIDGVDPADVAKIYRAAANAEAKVPGVRAFEPFAKAAESIAERMAADGELMTGAQLMNWRSKLVNEIQTLSRGSQPGTAGLRDAAWAAVEGIDELIMAQAGKAAGGSGDEAFALARQYADARRQWKTIQAVTDAVSAEGNVSAPKLHNILKRSDPVGYERGRDGSNFYNAVRFAASQLGRPIVGNSGTATRQIVNEIMSNPTAWGMAAAGLRGVTGSLVGRAYLTMPGAADILGEIATNNATSRLGAGLGRFAGGL